MVKLAAIEIGDGRQPDVRVRPHVDASASEELRRPHLVEEDEGTDHLPLRRGQGAAHLEAAEIAGAWDNDGLDDGVGIEAHVRAFTAKLCVARPIRPASS